MQENERARLATSRATNQGCQYGKETSEPREATCQNGGLFLASYGRCQNLDLCVRPRRDFESLHLAQEMFRTVFASGDMWHYYYRPTLELIGSNPQILKKTLREPVLMPVENLDLQIGVSPAVLRLPVKHQWAGARQFCGEHVGKGEPGYQADGIRVVAVARKLWFESFGEYEAT